MSNNSPKVIFRTVARNAEDTIARTAESILAQKYDNWELHLVNNGSTDSTGSIMEGYAAKDNRIKVFTNKGNYVWKKGNKFTDYYTDYDINNTFLCHIDGDDEYKPDFLEKMVPFAAENNLDIAASGYDAIDAGTGELLEILKAPEAFFIEGEKFGNMFPLYLVYMRTRWGKLYRLTVTSRLDLSRIKWVFYIDDTLEIIEHYRNAERAGIYPDKFYKWYISAGSYSNKWDARRIEANRLWFEAFQRYLTEKTGEISKTNYDFLLYVYCGEITRTIEVMLKAQNGLPEELAALHDIITDDYVKRLACHSFTGYKDEGTAVRALLFSTVSGWVIDNNNEFSNERDVRMLLDIIAVIDTLPQ